MFRNFRELVTLVWRRKWEVVVGALGILLALIKDTPYVDNLLIGLSAVILVGLLIDLINGIREASLVLREKHLPIVVIVGKDDNEYRAMLRDAFRTVEKWGFDEAQFAQDYDIFRDDLVVRRESTLPPDMDSWTGIIQKFETRINRLMAKLTGRKVFHIFLNCPTALAMGLGAILSTKHEVVLYKHQPGNQELPYASVIDFYALTQISSEDVSIIRSPVADREMIEVEQPAEFTPRTLVSLHLYGVDPKSAVQQLAQARGESAAHIRNEYGDRLAAQDEWLRVARETYTALQELLAQPDVERLELGISAYVVLSFAIGMALGTLSPVIVNSYYPDSREYRAVLDLGSLRSLA